MTCDVEKLEKVLPDILVKFNEVLNEHGIEEQVTRFMLGDPNDPSEKKKQEKIDEILGSVFKMPENPSDVYYGGCFVCCDKYSCYVCCYA